MTQKVWMITGASRGFGAEISKSVLEAGDRLVATARNTKGLDVFAGNPNVFSVELDVTDEQMSRAAVEAALQRFERIDVLVNNAGYGLLGAIEESSAAEVERLYRTNVFGLLNVTRAVLPGMRRQRAGHIINFSSIGGYSSGAGFGVYCSTKFAVEGITEALHDELAPLGIHATVVEPGYFEPIFWTAARSQRPPSESLTMPILLGRSASLPLGIITNSRAIRRSSDRRLCDSQMRPTRRFACPSAQIR